MGAFWDKLSGAGANVVVEGALDCGLLSIGLTGGSDYRKKKTRKKKRNATF